MCSEAATTQTVRPESVQQLSELLRDSAERETVIEVRGAGTKSTWGSAPGRPADQVIDLTGLDQVIDHAADDFVLTVQAGIPLAAVHDLTAAHRQRLALDPPEANAGATVGGVVATASSGPRRLRFGTPRDLLIGVTVVLADGTIARSGGKVVKNVAGYDLGKLFCGSFGTLGVIAECTLRLHPAARALRAVAIPAPEPAALVAALLRSAVVLSALEWDGRQLTAVVEAHERAVDQQAEQVRGVAGGGEITERVPEQFGARPWSADDVGVKLTFPLGALAGAIDAVHTVLPQAKVGAHAGSGVLATVCPADREVVDELRARITELSGQLVVVSAPEPAKRDLDIWGPAHGRAVMERVKHEFDPQRRLNPGRFVVG
jgi:glycolate oxidase FAD binding subunit